MKPIVVGVFSNLIMNCMDWSLDQFIRSLSPHSKSCLPDSSEADLESLIAPSKDEAMDIPTLQRRVKQLKKRDAQCSRGLDFEGAIRLRDEIKQLNEFFTSHRWRDGLIKNWVILSV